VIIEAIYRLSKFLADATSLLLLCRAVRVFWLIFVNDGLAYPVIALYQTADCITVDHKRWTVVIAI
jgi:hypothetical protein